MPNLVYQASHTPNQAANFNWAATPFGPNPAGTVQHPYPADPAYSNVLIPILWSTKLIDKFYDTSVVAVMSNTDYEGEIKNKGDHVVIRTRPDITVADYDANMDLDIERPAHSIVELLIDKGLYWNTALDDVMEVQSDLSLMNIWSQDASEQMRVAIDKECLDYYFTVHGGPAGSGVGDKMAEPLAGRISGNINLGTTGTPIQLTYAGTGPTPPTAVVQDIMDFVLRMSQALDEQNAPDTGRFLVLPAWTCQMLKASDLRMANEMGDGTSVFRNGQIGILDRFMVYKSNLLPDGSHPGLVAGEHVLFAGTTHSTTFASQVTKVETLRSEKSFSNLMRGLQVYGRQVINPKYLCTAVVTQ